MGDITMIVKLPKEWVDIKQKQAKQKGYIWSKYARQQIRAILLKEAKNASKHK